LKSLRQSLLLYVVTDRAWLNGNTLSSQVEQAAASGATCVQLREKELGYEEFLAEAKSIKAITDRYGIPLIINDSVDIALACGADGVHIGQGDMPACKARKLIGDGRILGVSVQAAAQALAAQRCGADYLGVGAVFPTSTKPDADAVSYDTLKNICGCVNIPVVAIGGITAANITFLAGSGIAGVAVVSAVFASSDIPRATGELLHSVRQVVV
jgi:thiamine-phosphate pyrophosphorylase